MSLLLRHRPQSLVPRSTHIDLRCGHFQYRAIFTEHTLFSYLSFPFSYIVTHRVLTELYLVFLSYIYPHIGLQAFVHYSLAAY